MSGRKLARQLFCTVVASMPLAIAAQTNGSAPAQASGLQALTAPGRAAATMNEPGPENAALAQRVGLWDVTETVWAAPGAPPQVIRAQVAERRLVGVMLEETLRATADRQSPTLRTDYLTFNRVEGRWEYVSMDTRAPVGIMPAWSYTRDDPQKIQMTFAPFAWVGSGEEVTGQLLRMQQFILRDGPDHDRKDQYFLMADGTGTSWLAHRYDYVRRP